MVWDHESSRPGPVPDEPGSLAHRAYEDLRGRILSGRLAPGAMLSERRLAAEMGMSKTPVHAAIERLAADGFLSVAAQRGIVVREVSVREIADHFEVREAIEPFLVARLAGRLGADHRKRLSWNAREHRRVARAGDVAAVVDRDAEFHLLLAEFQGNREFARLMAQVRDRVRASIHELSTRHPERMLQSVEEHDRIVEALVAGDGAAAAERMREHIRWGMQRLCDRGS
ncbi:putative HTH-type transcriptional regulator YdfH [Aquisphaera giovannonii]|uniref:Putative HTH-type transcriptional regulator YdfH n=1 Tax=Aquisphaera giovannonii TaxID=406548 RepID=A0A5B9W6H0_9BACT|nr:GntR family transcriptional regulator [Aquisphaera giovannonii]QEH36138.1 putative HTH-type transcriptional regulator YdfH [Aquisphaera giovannonii]